MTVNFAGNSDPIDVLIVEDCESDALLLKRHLRKSGLEVRLESLCQFDELRTALESRRCDIVLCDHSLRDFDSTDVLNLLSELGLTELPFILVSGFVDTETALATLSSGANDFVFKDDLSRLVPAIQRELTEVRILREKTAAEEALKKANEKLQLTLTTLASTQDQLVTAERFRALGQMSSGIAHDFNNALTKMLGTAVLLKQKQPGERDQLVTQLETQIQDAAAVVRRLCDFYRKNPANEETVVDINQVLTDTKEFTRPKWEQVVGSGAGPIEVIVRGESTSGIWGDPSQLREVLTNLVFNSVDAMKETGGTIELVSLLRGDFVQVEIRDDGPGMTDTVLKRCMEPLYTTKGQDGTGLGLSIVEGIIKSFGGTFELESELGKGTSIFINLRKAEEIESPSQTLTVEPKQQRKLKVLVVDDEPVINSMVERSLQHFGHETQSKLNPLEALELIGEEDFDLVVSDRSMPEMSGDAFALEMSKRHPGTRFVMVSGYGDLMMANGELPEGVDIILPKPTPPELLNETLMSLFPADDEEAVALVP